MYIRKTGQTLAWFNNNDQPALQRHECNNRFQDAAIEEYKKIILDKGINLGARTIDSMID